MSLGGLFANPLSSGPWVDTANIVTLVSAAVTAVNLNTGATLGWANPSDVALERIAAAVLGLGPSQSFRFTNAAEAQWRSGGAAPDLAIGRFEVGYLYLNDATGSPGGFVPFIDNAGRVGTSRTASGALSRQWASVCATAIQWGAATVAEDVSMTRPTTASTTWATVAATSGTPTGFTFDPGAHTGLTAGAEITDIFFDIARSVERATGAVATQRSIRVGQVTYAFVGASTISDAATFYLTGQPLQGTACTITRAYTIWADAGIVRIDGGGGTTSGNAMLIGPTTITANKWIDITQPVLTSGIPNILRVTGGAHTTLTLSTEAIDCDFALNRTVQFATGALGTQRAFVIRAPTYGFVAASTLTDAATFYVSGAPIAGTNATITNSYSLWCDAGTVRLDGDSAVGKGCALLVGPTAVPTAKLVWVDVEQPGLATPTAAPTVLRLISGGHTAMPASTEATDVTFDFSTNSKEFATGAITNQRAFSILLPTYGFVGASTITRAATVYISGPPNAGTNATITTSLALWVDDNAGSISFFGATPTLGGGKGVLFVGNANTNPGTNPTAGGILYSNGGAGTWRGSGGTVTAFGPAGPHCGACGYDSWRVAAVNTRWKSWHFECSHCGAEYKGGPVDVLGQLDEAQRTEKLEVGMGWEEVAAVMKIAA